MTGIVDYNAGNIKSVQRSLDALKAPYILSKNPSELKNADRLIFPGVGEASYAMEQLKKTGFDSFLKDWAQEGKKLLGICLGSQIIFDHSDEGDTECLGLISGEIKHFSTLWNERQPSEEEHKNSPLLKQKLKVPHIGWNDISYINGSSYLLEGIPEHSDFYFVHSYVIQPSDPSVIKAYADYGTMVPALVEKGSISAFQFHPEKSGQKGIRIIRNFVKDDLES